MRAYALTVLAKADIFDIWAYIAEASETAATVMLRQPHSRYSKT